MDDEHRKNPAHRQEYSHIINQPIKGNLLFICDYHLGEKEQDKVHEQLTRYPLTVCKTMEPLNSGHLSLVHNYDDSLFVS